MDSKQQHLMSSELNKLLVRFGGSLLTEQYFSLGTRTESSLQVRDTLSAAAAMAKFTTRWEAHIKQAANVLESPIYSVPVEVLTWIFEYALEEGENYDEDEEDHYHRSLHRMRQVSIRWRQTLDEMPRLWRLTTKMSGEAVERAVENSKNNPITVIFDGEDLPRDASESSRSPPIVGRMVTHSHRWGRLFLRTTSLDILADLLQESTPMLKSFELSTGELASEGERIPDDMLEYFLRDSPSLQHLSISEWCFSWGVFVPCITDLRTLKLENIQHRKAPTTDDLFRVLSCCPRLERLCISAVSLLGWPESLPLPITLPKSISLPSLEHIELDFDKSASIILNSLAIPPSTEIKIVGIGFSCTEDILREIGVWIHTASAQWPRPGWVAVKESARLGDFTIWFGDINFRLVGIDCDAAGLRDFMACLDAQWCATVWKIGLYHFTSGGSCTVKLSTSEFVDTLDSIFPNMERFELTTDATDEREVLERLSTPNGEAGEKWVFPYLREVSVTGPVSASSLFDFITARLAGSSGARVAQLTEITLTDAEGDRTHLDELIAAMVVE